MITLSEFAFTVQYICYSNFERIKANFKLLNWWFGTFFAPLAPKDQKNIRGPIKCQQFNEWALNPCKRGLIGWKHYFCDLCGSPRPVFLNKWALPCDGPRVSLWRALNVNFTTKYRHFFGTSLGGPPPPRDRHFTIFLSKMTVFKA